MTVRTAAGRGSGEPPQHHYDGALGHYDAALAEQCQHYQQLRSAALSLLYLRAKLRDDGSSEQRLRARQQLRAVQTQMTRCRQQLQALQRARLGHLTLYASERAVAKALADQPATRALQEAALLAEAQAEVEQLLRGGDAAGG